MTNKIKVLIVDDSSVTRMMLKHGLSLDKEIDVIDVAQDPYEARDKILQNKPDVVTLDVEMPKMDGITFLEKLIPKFPIPTIMVSSLTNKSSAITIEALRIGAVDFIQKPTSKNNHNLNVFINELRYKIKAAVSANINHWDSPIPVRDDTNIITSFRSDLLVAIGASTGGVDAVKRIMDILPANFPPVLIVQHMPPVFTKIYAEDLNKSSAMRVVEGKNGDKVEQGKAILAPGGKHMTLKKEGSQLSICCKEGDKVNGHIPSVDPLFNSVAEIMGNKAIGIILTGMGSDGSKGITKLKEKKGRTIAQNKETSIIFGMPNEAIKLGGIDKILPINQIANNIINMTKY